MSDGWQLLREPGYKVFRNGRRWFNLPYTITHNGIVISVSFTPSGARRVIRADRRRRAGKGGNFWNGPVVYRED